MIDCAELQARAGGLVALPKADEQRRVAHEHVQGCAACARAWREGEQMLALLDALPPPPRPSVEALARAAEGIRGELRAVRARARRERLGWLGVAAALLASIALVVRGALSPAAGVPSCLAGGTGLVCLSIELAAAAAPAAAMWLWARRGGPGEPVGFAALGAGGALAAQVWLVMHCHVHALTHELVFHTGGVALAAVLAAQVGRRLVPAARRLR